MADKGTREPFSHEQRVCQTIFDVALEKGLVTYAMTGVADGVDGDATVIKPPLTTPREDVMTMLDILESSIREVQKKLNLS